VKYYKDSKNELFAYDDNVKPSQIKKGLVELTKEEFDSTLAEQNKPSEEQRKSQLESSAYTQQNTFLNPNKKGLFDIVVYSPLLDMTKLPKMNDYKVAMELLWNAYHERVDSGSEDFDYTQFTPATAWSYVELQTEWVEYNAGEVV